MKVADNNNPAPASRPRDGKDRPEAALPASGAAVLRLARRHADTTVHLFSLAVVAAAWIVLGFFVAEQRRDVMHDAKVRVEDSRRILASHIDTIYESAETLLKVGNEWIAAQSTKTAPAPLQQLGTYMAALTASDQKAIVLVAVDKAGEEWPLVSDSASRWAPGGDVYIHSPAAIAAASAEIRISAQRFDALAGSDVLPLTMPAVGNPYGVIYLRALVPVRIGEGPFGAMMPNLPARVGVLRGDGEILLSWPADHSKFGQRVPEFVRGGHVAGRADSDFLEVKHFPGLGRAYASYAPLDVAPIGVYAALSADYVSAEFTRVIAMPCLITALCSALALVGGILIARLFRHSRIEVENTKRALNAAQTANEVKRQFLASMSHELRTPLNAIIGFTEIMHNQLFGPLGNPQYVAYSGDVYNSGRHLLRLIEDILDMARFEGGNVALGDGPTSLPEVVKGTVRLLHERINAKSIDVHIEGVECPAIRIDPLHLRQILINLVNNAIKFTRAGGVIAIDCEPTADGGIALHIADTGIGIPAEAIEKLFKPFSQVDGAYSRKQGGVGLGLSICRSIVEAYGGTISLKSKLDVGTTVSVHFPADRVIAVPAAPDALAAE